MNFPPEFIATITNTFGADGERFLADLPVLIDEASRRWELADIQPVPNLSYNFVAFARRGEVLSPNIMNLHKLKGQENPVPTGGVVLKIGVPRDELISEVAALRLFNGEGACKLIDADEEKGLLLLERLQPGNMLAEMEDDDEATRIAADLMKRIWRAKDSVTLSRSPERSEGAANGFRQESPSLSGRDEPSLRVTYVDKFIQLTDWFDGLSRLREMFSGGTGPLDEKLVERAEGSTRDFFAENHMPVLMHGDFHHFNILSSERGWQVIDPKGVIGPAGYEVGPLMMNPWGSFPDGIESRLRLKRRIDILHEQVGFERERILEWSLAHAILSAWWGIEDNTGWEYSMQFAGMLAAL